MPIFDQGYQHWQGPLSGHAWRWWAIAGHGIRVQSRNRMVRVLLILAWLPAIALVATMILWGLVEQQTASVLGFARSFLPEDIVRDAVNFRSTVWIVAYWFFFKVEMVFIMLLVVVAGPGLISRDLRFNSLPLYFARPLTRLDYFLGKLGVIGALVGAVAVGPAVFAYIVGACFSLDLSIVGDTYPILLASIAYGLVVTLSMGTLMLALSSLSKRSLYVGIAFAGMWLISGSVGEILWGIGRASDRQGVRTEHLERWVSNNPPPPGAKMRGPFPVLHPWQEPRKMGIVGVEAGHEEKAERWYRDWSRANGEAHMMANMNAAENAPNDWRPLCSYVNNMQRIADTLLDVDSAWVTIGRAVEKSKALLGGALGGHTVPGKLGRMAAPSGERALANQLVLQSPWQWSAGILAILVGISTWILFRRVKSLDRLK